MIRRKNKEKLRYVYIITSLKQGRIKKSFGMYISSLHYNTDGRGKRAVCIYNHFIITRNDKSFGMYISSLYYKKEG